MISKMVECSMLSQFEEVCRYVCVHRWIYRSVRYILYM